MIRSWLSYRAPGARFRPVIFRFSALPAFSFFLALGSTVTAQAPSLIPAQIDTSHVQPLLNHHPQWANAANDAGPLPASQPVEGLTLVLTRPPAQEAAFQQFLADQQNPASPDFHHWLTAVEIGDRFGRADTDVAAIKGWLQSQGLHVTWVAPSKTFVGFAGTAADVSRAFQTELHNYHVNGRTLVSVSSDPMVPQAVAPAIKAIRGLYTIEEDPQNQTRVMQMDSPAITGASGETFIGPGDFYTIYSLPNGVTGAGITIGIVARSRTDPADFVNFKPLLGTIPIPTEVVPTAFGGVDPGPAYTSPPGTGVSIGDQAEATLDVERAGSAASGAQLLLVVTSQASGGIEVDAQYLVQTVPAPAQVMNISFGSCESSAGPSGVNFWDSLFQQAAAEGISSFVASGDSGASGCDVAFQAPPVSPQANSPNYICSSSYATCVGGTEFNDTSDPAMYWQGYGGTIGTSAIGYIPEGGWNESWNGTASTVAASGGGVSSVIATPAWQQGIAGVPRANAGRYTPDLAFSASQHDGYLGCFAAGGGSCVVSNGSTYFTVFSGTSAAAPSMAAIAAMVDQNANAAEGNLNPGIYQMSISAPTAFHDITLASSGVSSCDIDTPSMCNNSIPGPSGLSGGQAGYEVGTGYDEVTGLGSLLASTFVYAYPTASKLQTPLISVESLIWPVNQQIPIGVGVAGGAYSPGPTGNVVLTIGSYTSAVIPETGAYQYVDIPAGTLAMGTYTVTASYTPDAASSAIYSPASVTGQLTVSAPQYIAPTVVLSPSATTITSTEPITLSVSVRPGLGNPAPTGTVTVTSGSYSSGPVVLVPGNGTFDDGEAVINIPAGSFPVGQDTLSVTYVPDTAGAYLYVTASGSYLITNVGAQSTPTVQVRPGSPTVTTDEILTVAVVVSAAAFYPTPTGSIVLSGGNYTSTSTSLTGNGQAYVEIAPGALAVGSDLLTATYTPDAQSSALYTGGSGTSSVTVTIPADAAFTVAGNSPVISKGSETSNTSVITVTPTNGFIGTVTLSAAVTASPSGAQDLPTMTFAPASVDLAGLNPATSTLTFTTTAASSAKLASPISPWMRWSAAAPALACFVLWLVPLRRRLWRNLAMFAVLAIFMMSGLAACGGSGGTGTGGGGGGGGNSGTTSGQYTITITGTSGSMTETSTLTLTVQ
jgi:subtilisin family serine protease